MLRPDAGEGTLDAGRLPACALLLASAEEDAVVALAFEHAEELVPDLAGPGAHIGLRGGVARPDLENIADGELAHSLLGLEKRPGARRSAGVDYLSGGNGFQIGRVERAHS